MPEILFSDSAAGSLKQAKHKSNSKDSVSSVKSVTSDNEFGEVFGFNLMWSIGSIAEKNISENRLNVLRRLFSFYPDEVGCSAAVEIHDLFIKNIKTVRELAAKGEKIRIWYSNNPDEMCGLLWFLSLLKQWNLPSASVTAVKLPEYDLEDDAMVVRNGWNEVEPEKWENYLSLQQELSPVLILATASQWKTLQEENAPLRAVINGRIHSVPQTFYDSFIIREIEMKQDEFNEAVLIGNVLGKYQLGISDTWVALRIEEMINAGKLKAITTAPVDFPSYHRILRK